MGGWQVPVVTTIGCVYPCGVRKALIFKPLASAAFLVVALAQSPASRYDWLVLAGLVCGAIGDVALIPASRRWFMAGLVAFLAGHVAYVFAFAEHALLWALPWPAIAGILALGAALFLYFRPHLGSMLEPVIGYMLVITLMLVGAWSVWYEGGDTAFGRVIAAGATLFYVSDITVARDRFVAPGNINRFIGLPLYYAGQFLLAFSIGM